MRLPSSALLCFRTSIYSLSIYTFSLFTVVFLEFLGFTKSLPTRESLVYQITKISRLEIILLNSLVN